jgi:hypothetical protein
MRDGEEEGKVFVGVADNAERAEGSKTSQPKAKRSTSAALGNRQDMNQP